MARSKAWNRVSWIAVLLVALIAVLGHAQLPGFKVTLGQRGLDYARQVGITYVQQHFQTVTVPNQSGSAHAPVVGDVDWSLSNIVLSGLSIPSSSISIKSGSGIAVSISGAALSCTMDFQYREKHWPHVKGHGNLVISISGTAIDVSIRVGETNGKPSLSVLSSSCSMGSLDVKEHGGPSWLYNFFLSALHDTIKKAAQNAVGSSIANLINQGGNQALQTVQMQEQFDGIAEVDYSFVAPPTFGQDYMTFNSRGEFYYLPQKSEAPYSPRPMPDTSTQDMLEIFVGDYVPNTASYVFWKAGKMQGELKDKDLPSWSPIRLNTSSWQVFIPKLYQMYPNMAMVAVLSPLQPPLATFTPQGISVAGNGQIVVSAVAPNGQLYPVFAIGLNISTSAAVAVSGGRLTGKLDFLNSAFSLMWSKVGDFDFQLLDSIITMLSKQFIVPFFNTYLAQGVNIPTVKGVTFTNPTIGYGQNYLNVATDISYT